jgi:hypothetical protein
MIIGCNSSAVRSIGGLLLCALLSWGCGDGAVGDDVDGGGDAMVGDVGPIGMTALFINEVAAKGTAIGPFNPTASDWVELFNQSNSTLDLAGYRLIDSAKKGFAEATALPPHTKIPARGYLILYFNNDGAGTPNIDGKLGKDEALSLYHPGGLRIDVVNWELGDSPAGKSWGRSPDGSSVFKTFVQPTPGAPNE